ncbi:alpha-1,4-glucan:maltose-1-phosphate maltosyltransferase [Sphingomonas metalli]|uniref:Alpha-1,4-glucan:maltose-1-phosphate maltosyltransferase n=1 Tax=Sphingomonas metalli TaxID=1779358 RepID=A0A916T0R3_9SPHN|nr:alpha-1,4-glucan--maltose-1-phosphate maltosyltransferase [Sphingomonas metalli]GGB24842.1 alpha-1,4-glucan:maltose-1-phosphate maltosyltransferase [Sphingomonas metalli]
MAEPVTAAPVAATDPVSLVSADTAARDWPRLVVEEWSPRVDGGDFAVKRVVGETVTVEATLYGDGHEQLAAELLWRGPGSETWQRVRMTALPTDRWTAEWRLEEIGRHEYVIEGWLDIWGGFRRDFAKKLDAGVAQDVDAQEGRGFVSAAAERAPAPLATRLRAWLERLEGAPPELLLDAELATLMAEADERPFRVRSPRQLVDAERIAARFSSWYELFPRSITDSEDRHGTFDDVIGRLPQIRDMGFDTLYFPPIHPIGRTNRKGPNNTLSAGPGDPGSPYAIGAEEGGHDAVHPELGGFAAFGRLVEAARQHGLEIALDFAIQCSPDHPWLKDHPGWFAWRSDGSMKYAENPPKKYQDIVNVDFYGPDAIPDLWVALRDVVLLWIEHGVKTFRVDNPHTKPLPFWEWMIGDVRARHPDAIFLAEAFTRPTMMYRLAKIGFSQSYTYFTWRDTKVELTEYITELTTTAPKEFYRPHFFVNTPDINPVYLQTSGRPGFRIRAVLAATLSGLFGVYSGFELCEADPVPGKEEYNDSEKYIVKPRDWNAPGNIILDIAMLNRIRRRYPALQTHLGTKFFVAHDDNIIWYGRPDPDGGEGMICVMINLDPHNAHECRFEVPLWEFGLGDDGDVAVEDLAEGYRFRWYGKEQTIRIAPDQPYRIWRLTREHEA